MNKYALKDKLIKIYFERESEEGIIKKYIHPIDVSLKAYVRQVASFEMPIEQTMHDTSQVIFVINDRKVRTYMLIEFNGKTYNINAIDEFEFYNHTDLKITASEIEPKRYIKAIGSDISDYSKY